MKNKFKKLIKAFLLPVVIFLNADIYIGINFKYYATCYNWHWINSTYGTSYKCGDLPNSFCNYRS